MYQPNYTKDDINGMLRARDITPTHQRVEIAHVVLSRCEHLSADRILALVNENTAEVSKATVYNTLALFVQKNLVREVIVDPTRVFYDPNVTPHHHFYNVNTGELMDIAHDHVSVSDLPAPPEGMVTESVDIIVRVRNAGIATPVA